MKYPEGYFRYPDRTNIPMARRSERIRKDRRLMSVIGEYSAGNYNSSAHSQDIIADLCAAYPKTSLLTRVLRFFRVLR